MGAGAYAVAVSQQVHQIHQTAVGQPDRKFGLTISAKIGQPTTIENRSPQADELAAFLMAFPPSYLQKEPTNFYTLADILWRYLDDVDPKEANRQNVAKARERFTEILDKPDIRYEYKNESITPRKLIDLWFNGHYFHKDAKTVEEFERLRKVMGKFFQFIFIDSIFQLSNCVTYLAALATHALAKESS